MLFQDFAFPDLGRHFYSEGGADFVEMRTQLRVLDGFMRDGHILLEEMEIDFAADPSKTDPLYSTFCGAFIKRAPTPPRDNSGYSRSGYHSRLKWAGWSWLRSLGDPAPEYEFQFQHSYGIADVFSTKLAIAIECGNTQAGKVVAAFEGEREPIDRVVILPFAWDTENGGRFYGPRLRASVFSSTSIGRAALRSDDSFRHNEIRDKFMRPRKRGRPRKSP